VVTCRRTVGVLVNCWRIGRLFIAARLVRLDVEALQISGDAWMATDGSHPYSRSQFGNGTLRLTTRQCYQLHGVLKQDLKSVFSSVVKNMGSTLVRFAEGL